MDKESVTISPLSDKPLLPEIVKIQQKVEGVTLPPDLKEKLMAMVQRLVHLVGSGAYAGEYETVSSYVDCIVSLPWFAHSLDNLNLDTARRILEKNHYGLDEVKERILEYLAVLNLQIERHKEEAEKAAEDQENASKTFEMPKASSFRATVLCLVGLPGIGKTTLAVSVAEALDRKFIRIAFGGMGSAVALRGQSRALPNAEPGLVVRSMARAGTKNPVILLDEIDRVAEGARAEIMGVLIELLDPEQNMAFADHYLGCPFDLSEVMFIASCNNTGGIANAVLDRLEMIQMPSYTDEEKMVIAKSYLFPRELKNTGLSAQQLIIDDDVWSQVIRPLGFDAGVRTLDRTIQGMCRKIAKKIVLGEGKEFRVTTENVREFLSSF